MSKRILAFISAIVISGIILGAALVVLKDDSKTNNKKDDGLTELSLMLDWTPNTNHTGIFVALDKKWYEEEGIKLKIIPYSSSASTDVIVANQKADLGISFTESIVSSSVGDSKVKSIAAILPRNTSSIAVRKSDNIKTPKDLDGKTYGGFGTLYDEPVMKQIIKTAGGKGDIKSVVIDTDPLAALENEQVDFVWIFDGWQKIEAELNDFEIKTFPLVENGVPNYYTPNIISSETTLKNKSQAVKKFLKATEKGYEFAADEPTSAAKILIAQADKSTFPNEDLVIRSQKYLSGVYKASAEPWGFQKDSFWQEYPKFMLENEAIVDNEGKIVTKIDFKELYTNDYLPKS
jgi:ABC-type nitrate/sulfonate/bicarbonate transport system substrate-binding protein